MNSTRNDSPNCPCWLHLQLADFKRVYLSLRSKYLRLEKNESNLKLTYSEFDEIWQVFCLINLALILIESQFLGRMLERSLYFRRII